jgi:hypothetical protein
MVLLRAVSKSNFRNEAHMDCRTRVGGSRSPQRDGKTKRGSAAHFPEVSKMTFENCPDASHLANANGIQSSSPGLPRPRGYPGLSKNERPTLKGLNQHLSESSKIPRP